MKLRPNIFNARARAGILLIECVVYIAVFALLLGVGTAAFYVCWDYSKALIYTTDDIGSALRAGERWRADVRGATGKISVETTATDETVKIPEGAREIIYRLASGEMRRQAAPSDYSELLLAKVKSSRMKMETRGGVTAWRWELELTQRRRQMNLPLDFTFEAAQPNP